MRTLRLGVVDRALSVLDGHVGEGEVVSEARIDLDEVGPAHGVDGPVAARDRTGGRLAPTQPELVAPVEAFAVRPLGLAEGDSAGDVPDVRVAEVADELPEGIRLPDRTCIGEGDDLRVDGAHRLVLGRDLATARAADEPHAAVPLGEPFDECLHAVGGGIGGDEDLEPARVVLRQEALDEPLDDLLLVVRRDHDRDARRDVLLRHAHPSHGGESRHEERVTHMRPEDRAEAGPEEDLEDDHRGADRTRADLQGI
jgi:hypothetical protein